MVQQLIAEGSSKLASVPSGGSGGAASGGAAAATSGGAAAEAPAEEKEEEKEVSTNLLSSSTTYLKVSNAIIGVRRGYGFRSLRLSGSPLRAPIERNQKKSWNLAGRRGKLCLVENPQICIFYRFVCGK